MEKSEFIFDQMLGLYGGAINLFRDGGFATVDEFSYLARHKFPEEVNGLKRLMRVVLALHNPEEQFSKSEYYRFVQKLFQPDLYQLREDVAVLSFNYDAYLEFLLWRACYTRRETLKEPYDFEVADLATSGFYRRSINVLRKKMGFCLLKLHGTIATPTVTNHRSSLCFDDLFIAAPRSNLANTLSKFGRTLPPIIFPWEFRHEEGTCPKDKFCLNDESIFAPKSVLDDLTCDIHALFEAIWYRAQVEITSARRVSFVGISMHPYLHYGFEWLFEMRMRAMQTPRLKAKLESLEVVVANPDAVGPVGGAHRGVCKNVIERMNHVCPDTAFKMEICGGFGEFIDRFMDPIEKR